MDQKGLESLVNEVDLKARKFSSFDDFLKSQKDGNTEWSKPVEGAVDNSSSSQDKVVAETVESPKPTSAAPATSPIESEKTEAELAEERRKYLEFRQREIAEGFKSESLAHPVAPNVTSPEPSAGKVLEAQIVTTKYELHSVEWDKDLQGQPIRLAYLSDDVKVRTEDPEWHKEVYLGGQAYARAVRDIGDPKRAGDRIVDLMNVYQERIERCQVAIQGMRGELEQVLHGETSENRVRLNERAAGWRKAKNQDAKERIKAERAPAKPKGGIGIKFATAFAEMFKMKPGQKTVDKLIAQCHENNAIDEMTIEHINKTWGAK